MANSNRLAKSYLADLQQNSDQLFKVGFTPLIRYLEANAPLAAKVGYSVSPKQDFVRFGQKPLLQFYPAAFCSVDFSDTIGFFKLKNSYFGFFGINGPLPTHLTEYALERKYHHRDSTFSEFLDVFNHRFVSLFYRAWADAEPTVCHDRPEKDPFLKQVSAIAGEPVKEKDTFNQQSLLYQYLAGLLSHKNRSGKVLIQLLAEYLGVNVDISEFEGQWYDIPESTQLKLGQKNGALGLTSVIGGRTFQRTAFFTISIGPIEFDQYIALLNNSAKFKKIVELTRNFVGFEYEFAIKIYLKPQQTRPAQLGQAKLGQTAWSQDVQGHLQQTKPIHVYTRAC